MRITAAQEYTEQRDTISRDWSNYMLSAFPDSQFVFIPNIEENVISYIDNLKLNVIILTGGDDMGVYPKRDKTETLILEHALKNKIPLIAICRGLQLVHTYFGGKLKRMANDINFVELHKSSNHSVIIHNSVKIVNSYHTNQIVEDTIADCFEVFARCKDDDSVEGIKMKGVLAIMWHPERDNNIIEWNKLLLQDFLKNEK